MITMTCKAGQSLVKLIIKYKDVSQHLNFYIGDWHRDYIDFRRTTEFRMDYISKDDVLTVPHWSLTRRLGSFTSFKYSSWRYKLYKYMAVPGRMYQVKKVRFSNYGAT